MVQKREIRRRPRPGKKKVHDRTIKDEVAALRGDLADLRGEIVEMKALLVALPDQFPAPNVIV